MKIKSILLLVGLSLTANLSSSLANEGGLLSMGNGSGHSLGVTSIGTVYGSGNNNAGQLGNGTTTNSSSPVAVTGLTGCVKVAAGSRFSMALKSDGTVWTWGSNTYGQLGDGTTTNRSTAAQVTGLTGVTGIASGANSAYALKSDGTVWAWGVNSSGQLGDGSTTQRTLPVQVSSLTAASSIGAGTSSCMALRSDGTVWCWGDNSYGQLGDSSLTQRTTPVQVTGLTGVSKIASGYYHAMAVKPDGSVSSWGMNYAGQLGIGVTGVAGPFYTSPQSITGISQVTFVSAGGSHSLAIKSDGSVWAWGEDTYGQLGDSATASATNVPVYAAGFSSDASMVAAGGSSTLALESNGYIWAWGSNVGGMLGDGTTTNRFLPSFVGAR
ncbi:MAG: hypothetical protein V4726_12395 [Verrucomicrobiota bacterium]